MQVFWLMLYKNEILLFSLNRTQANTSKSTYIVSFYLFNGFIILDMCIFHNHLLGITYSIIHFVFSFCHNQHRTNKNACVYTSQCFYVYWFLGEMTMVISCIGSLGFLVIRDSSSHSNPILWNGFRNWSWNFRLMSISSALPMCLWAKYACFNKSFPIWTI